MVMTVSQFDAEFAADIDRQLSEESAQLGKMLGRPPKVEQQDDPDIGSAVDAFMSESNTAQRVQASVALSADTDSDYEAELRRISAKTGVPLESARAFPEDVKRQSRLNDWDFEGLARDYPQTSRFLGSLSNARIAHDDVDSLRGVENALKPWAGSEPSIGSVLSGLGEAAKLKPLISGVKLAIHDAFFDDGSVDSQVRRADLTRKAMQAQSAQTFAHPDFESSTASGLYGGGVSLVQNIPGIAASILTGNPAVGLTMAGVQSGAPAYAKYLDRGASDGQAIVGALGEGGVEVATELLPMGFLVKKLGKAGAGQFLTGLLVRELPLEQAATHAQDAIDTAIANPDKTWGEYAAERPDAVYQTLLGTLVASGSMGAVHTVAKRMQSYNEKAAQVGQQTAALDAINKAAQASKLLQRDPDTFEQFVAEAAEAGPVDQVYIDANTLMQSGIAEEVSALSPAVAAQLSEALATGGTIAVPVSEYSARIAPSEYAQGLLDHLRTIPDGFSRAEAQTYMQSIGDVLMQEVEQSLQVRQADSATNTSQQAVKTTVLDNLNAVNRFRPEVNEAYATLEASYAATRAADLGMTPEEFFTQHRVTVVAENIAGSQFEQSAKVFDGGMDGLLDAIDAKQIEGERFVNLGSARASEALRESTGIDADGARMLAYSSDVKSDHQGHPRTTRADWQLASSIFSDHDAVGRSIAQRGAKGERLTFVKNDGDEAVGVVYEVFDSPRYGRQAVLKGLFRDDRKKIETWFKSNTRDRLEPGLMAAGGDSRLPNNPESGPNQTFPSSNDSIGGKSGEFNQAARGSFNPETGAIALLKGADLSTFLHESGHYFFETDISIAASLTQKQDLTPGEQRIVDDVSKLLTWHGIQGSIDQQIAQWYGMGFEEKRAYHERTAESFEAYLFNGTAPSVELQPYFQRFRDWLLNVYKSVKRFLAGHPEAGQLNDEVRGVFDRMLATNDQIALAQQGRSMMEMFANPEQGSMTSEEFAAYQALNKDATAAAQQNLQTRGLRDMRWMHNARGREVKKLQKQAKELRASVRAEVATEVQSQPVYRAWAFLTGKRGVDDRFDNPLPPKSDPNVLDESVDSLFVAIAKLGGLNKDQVVSEWGIGDKPESGVFGKPVWRIDGGLTLDGMVEALAQRGYLTLDVHGEADMREFEERFGEELAGRKHYSNAVDPAVLMELPPAGAQLANPGGLTAARLDRDSLTEMPTVQTHTAELLKARRMTATEGGLHPDLVAELFGFTSGDQLVHELADAQPPREVIEAMTDQRMLERYGDLSSPDAMQRAADHAIHNAVRERFIETEANALAKAAGQRKVLGSAARTYARAMIARIKVRNVRPSMYGNAETRAAKAAEKASRAGDLSTAAAEKRNQLFQAYAARAAHEALDDVDKGIRYLKKFGNEGTRKALDTEYLDQIDGLLDRFDLRSGQSLKAIDKRTSLAKWIESQRAAGLDPDIPDSLMNEAFRQSYKDMTVEEFRGLIDSVKQIEHLGRLKHRLLAAKDAREFRIIADEVANGIVQYGGKAREVELETPTGIKPWLDGLAAGHRKVASLVRQMDGGNDGGPFWKVFVRSMNEAATTEAVMIEQATMRLAELYKPILAMKGGVNGDKQFISEINASLTRGGRLSVALNWGNDANRQRIMGGDRWTPEQVNAILSRLTREEWQFVQDTWAFIDGYWPQIAAKEKRVTGREPEKVEASPFSITLADGSTLNLSGGYYPIKYDANRDDRAEKLDAAELAKDMLRGAMTRSTTRRGHTKQRAEQVKRPVRKTLDVLTQHISEVTHDLAWHEWLIDANRIINDGAVNEAVRAHYGTDVVRTMKDALTAIATADIIPQTKIDQAMLYLRANVSRSTMGLSLTTAFLQPFGLTQSMARIGTKHVMHGMRRWVGDAARMESSMTWIQEKSDFMRLRGKTFNRELNEIKGRVSHGHSRARQIYDASLFMLMGKMQMLADVPTWIGAYEKARSNGQDEAMAVALADQSVLDSQGGGQTKDMSEFQRKHPFLTMFYSYFNTTLNLAAESTAKTDFKKPLAVAGWASDMALLMVIPALGPAMLLSMLRGEDACEDLKGCAAKMAKDQTSYMLNTVIGLRELSGSVAGFDYAGPPIGRVVSELGRTGTQIKQGEVDEGLARSAISLLGVSLGIPTTQILRSWKGWNAWEEGDAPATSILLGPPQKD